jgi:hypothetical protein
MYNYQTEKPKIFTEQGQADFLKTRDSAEKLLSIAGAFNIMKVLVTGDQWLAMAYIDRLVELGEIRELTDSNVRGQDRVFISAK